MDRKPDDEVGIIAALLGMTFICLTTWGVAIWALVVAIRMLSRGG